VLGPAKLPSDVANVISKAINDSLNDPRLQETMRKNGLDVVTGSPQDFARTLDLEFERWGKTIRDSKIQVD
jgi:tripartite-type tricarboxylate transporter receptor subunit TctC